MRAYGLIPAVFALVATRGRAQTAPVDQGSFTVTKAGVPFGSESFLIIRQPVSEGASYTLSSTRVIQGRTIRTSLKTDSMGYPITYMRQEVGGSPATLTATGQNFGRLTVNLSKGDDRSSKDYLIKPGTLILDDDLLHQLYFVCLNDHPRSIPYVSPESQGSATGTLAAVGTDDVELGNKARVAGRHYSFGSGDEKREIWIDSSGRLLRVSIPGRQIEAVRDEPPR